MRQGKGWFEQRLGPATKIEWFGWRTKPCSLPGSGSCIDAGELAAHEHYLARDAFDMQGMPNRT